MNLSVVREGAPLVLKLDIALEFQSDRMRVKTMELMLDRRLVQSLVLALVRLSVKMMVKLKELRLEVLSDY